MGGGGVNVFHATLHMSSLDDCTYRSTSFFATLHTVFCMIVHTANIFHATLLMSSLHDYCRRSIREVRRQNGRKITVGTQTLDKCWDYCKDLIPIKNKLLNAEIWNYVYQWQWRYHHRHALWQMVPKALKELCA